MMKIVFPELDETNQIIRGQWGQSGSGEWRTSKRGKRYIAAHVELIPDVELYLNIYPISREAVQIAMPLEMLNLIRLAVSEYYETHGVIQE